KVFVMGMGKSRHLARKMAATSAITGSPSFFVHPGDASHGDLGTVTPQHVVLDIPNPGESAEITALIPVLTRLHTPIALFTGRHQRTTPTPDTSSRTLTS
ncbi:SIS domain-containing protein, partial [Escherichia coli]|uniref:SIS domain-containing protein n=1 Tax=Escherichia coli TaxID=562 RepID=UPI001115997B